jgi:UPF0716 family protein affecting phage T7 exclusion
LCAGEQFDTIALIIMPFLGFVLIFLEFYVFIVLGRSIGVGAMFGEILLSGALGYALIRFGARTAFQPAAQLIGIFLHAFGAKSPTRRPAEWLLFGSLLLILPGVITDVLGLIFVIGFFLRRGPLRQPPSKSEPIDVPFTVQDEDDSS